MTVPVPSRPPGPDPVVRIAGVPRSALAALRAPRSAALASSLLTEETGLAEEGRRIADALEPVIGALPDPALKPRLVGLRRAAHRGRTPRPAEWDTAVRGALPVPLADRVGHWLAARERYAAHAAELPDLLATEAARALAALRGELADERFRQGLLHASRPLDDELERWLTAPDGSCPTGPGTKALVSLVRYLARSAAKTSPFGAFTASARARWTTRDGAVQWGEGVRWDPAAVEKRAAVAELNLARLRRIADALLRQDPALRADLRLRPNPALETDSEVLRLISPGHGARIAVAPAPAQLPRLVEAMGRWDGAPAAGAGPGAERLRRAGLLQAEPPLADQAADHLAAFTDWIRSSGGPEATAALPALDGLHGALRRYPAAADHHQRRALESTVGATLRDTERALGLPDRLADFERRPFHEDTVLTAPAADLDPAAWRPVLADLAAVGRALALLDRDLPARLAAAAWLRERYGPDTEVPLLVFLHELENPDECASPLAGHVRDLLRPGFGADGTLLRDSPLAEVRALAARRGAWTDRLARGEHLPAADPPRMPGSLAYYVQPLPGTADLPGPRAVLNAVTVGHGHWSGRLERMLARAADGPVPDGPDDRPPGPATGPGPGPGPVPVPVDISGAFAANTNLRAPTLRDAFDHPFVRGGHPAARRVPLGGLTVRADSATGLPVLRRPSHGTDLVPVHLGLMTPMLLPPPLRALLRIFGEPHSLFRTGHPLLPGPFAGDVPSEGARRLPRVEAGRVVLRRAGWLTRARSVPRRAPGEPHHTHLLRLLAWRAELGLPERCFVRTARPDAAGGDVFADKGYKPAYLDFTSPLLVTAFERGLKDPDTVVYLEEALPDPVTAEGGPYTCEFIVELPGDHGD